MTNDRALIEAAAAAAGMTIDAAKQVERDAAIGADKAGLWLRNGTTWWNPLESDGDALRLAVGLGLRVEPLPHGCSVMWPSGKGMRVETVLNRVIGADSDASTRRAITVAAASMAK